MCVASEQYPPSIGRVMNVTFSVAKYFNTLVNKLVSDLSIRYVMRSSFHFVLKTLRALELKSPFCIIAFSEATVLFCISN